MKTSRVLAASVIAAILEIGSAAQASTIYDSLGSTVLGWVPINPGGAVAQSFTTGAESATFNSVTLAMYEWQPIGGFAVHLYDSTGAGNAPGALLLTLEGSDRPGSGNYSYTGTLSLTPNTTYWVEADATYASGANYEWSVGLDDPTIGSGIGRAAKENGAEAWTQYSMGNLLMLVDATPSVVPEPGSIALIALGGLGLLLRRQRSA